jgi:hypothetical protein
MHHEAECHIVVDTAHWQKLMHREPPIPPDKDIEAAFPDWRLRCQTFAARCVEQEGKKLVELTALDYFRYGMKFVIAEASLHL